MNCSLHCPRELKKGMIKMKLLLFAIIFFAFGVNVYGREFEETRAALRREVFSAGVVPMGEYTPQIFIDRSGIIHTPPKHLELAVADDEGYVVPLAEFTPYRQGDSRTFRHASGTATLTRQGERVNVWTISATTAARVDAPMVEHFDLIVRRMEQSFAPFAGVRVYTPFGASMPVVGDTHRDGRVNVLLHNHTSGGFFSSGDFGTSGGNAPIPLIHVGSSLINDRDVLNNLFAHEFQHLLFYMYFGVYMAVENSAVTAGQFLWFDEALSELAGFLYANPGSETISVGSNFSAAENDYYPGDGRFGDFIHFNNSFKNYGMSGLYAKLMHRTVEGYTRAIYSFLRTNFPPARNGNEFMANHRRTQSQNMMAHVGDMHYAAGLTMGERGERGFGLLYSIFMEDFAADGGSVDGFHVVPFINSPYAAHRLWGIRPNLGTNTRLYFDSTSDGAFTLTGRTAFPALASGGTINLRGFDGTSPAGASHERFYLLPGNSAANHMINIRIHDNSGQTFYYLVVPNDALGAVSSRTNRTLGQHGATVHSLAQDGTPNFICTGGQDAYLFVVTLLRDVQNVRAEYSWINQNATATQMRTNLQNLISRAQDLHANTRPSQTGEDIPRGDFWATPQALSQFYAAIEHARNNLQ